MKNCILFNSMKNIRLKLVSLFKEGYCTPQISRIARTIDEPSTTIHYNIKKLESEGVIKTYKAVFDYTKINEGFCAYVFVANLPSMYSTPERVAMELTKHDEVESIDLITGDWQFIMKVRTKDQDEFYRFLRDVVSVTEGFQKTFTMVSLKQFKTEFISFTE